MLSKSCLGSVRNPPSSPAQGVRVRQCGFFHYLPPPPHHWWVGVKVRHQIRRNRTAAEFPHTHSPLPSRHQHQLPRIPRILCSVCRGKPPSSESETIDTSEFLLGPRAAQSKGTCDNLENEGTNASTSHLCSGEGGEGGGCSTLRRYLPQSRGREATRLLI